MHKTYYDIYDSEEGYLMTLEMKNIKALTIEITFPEEEDERTKIIDQISKIKVENLKVFPSPFTTIISVLEEAPLLNIRSPNRTYSFNKKEFVLRVSDSQSFPEPDIDEKTIEFNEDLINSIQSHYNLMIGMIVGLLNTSNMDVDVIINYESDIIYNFNNILNDKLSAKLHNIFNKGIFNVYGFSFYNLHEVDEIEYSYRYWLNDTKDKINIRYEKEYNYDIINVSIKDLIDESLININKFFAIG